MTYREYVASLRAGAVEGVYVFYGKEDYLRKDAVERLRKKLLPPGLEDLNAQEMTNPSVQQMTDALYTLPFMAERRIVLVRELALLGGESGKGKGGEVSLDPLLDLIEHPIDTACLVIDAGEAFDKRRRLGKALAQLPGCVCCDPLDERELQGFLGKQAKALGACMEPDAAERLVFLSGRDLQSLMGEMEKLAAYAGARNITVEDVEAIATRSAEARVFDMIDLLLEGRTALAYAQLGILLENGEARLGILALIARQIRQMLFVKEMMAEGMNQSAIGAQLGLKPFIVGKIASRARRISSQTLRAQLEACTDTEYRIKSGALREDAALDGLMLNLRMGE